MPPTPSLILQYRQSRGNWQSIPLPDGNLTIGRSSRCQLQLYGTLVSRQHAEIRKRGNQVWIVDLGSANGTRVDGKALERNIPHPICPGQTVTIGNYSLSLREAKADRGSIPDLSKARPGAGHIFISYSRRNKELVYPLTNKLEESGFNVWIDKQDIIPGSPWRGQIVQAIAEADAFILLLTPDSVASENVRKELDLAIEADLPIIPVILLPVKITTALKYQLVGVQRVNLFDDPEGGFVQITQALRQRQDYLAVHPRVRPGELQAEVVLPGMTVNEFYREKQQRLINFLAQAMRVNPNAIRITSFAAGSVRVIVAMPASAAYELKAQALNNNPILAGAGISALRLIGDRQFIQLGGKVPPGGGSAGHPTTTSVGGTGGAKLFLWAFGLITIIIVGILVISSMDKPRIPVAPTPPKATIHVFTPVPTITHTTTREPYVTRTPTPEPGATRTLRHTPTISPSPTRTLTRTPTQTLTFTVESPTVTEYMCAPTLRTEMDAHCRAGPGTIYDIVTSLDAGETALIDGQNETAIKWWWIQLPGSWAHCWISDATVSTYGDPGCVQVIQAPPTPTPTDAPPPAPTLISPIRPVDVSCYYSTSIDLIWGGVTDPSGVDHYEWQLESLDSLGNVTTHEEGATNSTSVSVSVECILDYRWRVRAIDGTGNVGPYAGYQEFFVGSIVE